MKKLILLSLLLLSVSVSGQFNMTFVKSYDSTFAITDINKDTLYKFTKDGYVVKFHPPGTPFDTLVYKSEFDSISKKTNYYVSPEDFGATGNGIDDDSASLELMTSYIETYGGNILFGKEKHYIYSGRTWNISPIDYLEIDFNGSTLEFTYNGTALSGGLQLVGGQANTYYDVSADIVIGDNVIRVSDANFFTGLRQGDIVNIRDTTVFSPTWEPWISGEVIELIEVDSANGVAYTASKFNDDYLVYDEAEVCKFDVSTFYVHDGTIKQNRDKPITGGDDSNYGIQLSYSKNSVIENMACIGAKYSGLQISLSYNPKVLNQTTTGADQVGAGYGCNIFNAVTGAFIDNLKGYRIRHAIANSGGTRGVPWNTIGVNSVGHSVHNTHVFDMHSSTGRAAYINCYVYLGVDIEDTASFREIWNPLTPYVIGDIVEYNTALYEAISNSTGSNPETSTNWDRYRSGAFGFMMNGRYGIIKNCHVYNASYMFSAGNPISNIIIDGLYGENVAEGIFVQTDGDISKGYINNVVIKNTARKPNDFLFRVVNSGLDSTILGRFSAKNAGGMRLSNPLKSLNFESIECTGQILDISSFSTPIDIGINNLHFTDSEDEPANIARLDETNLNSLSINNYTARNCGYGYQFFVDANLENLAIHNSNLYFESNQPMILVGSGDVLTNCLLGDVTNLGSVSGRIGTNLGTIDKYKGGALLGTWIYEWSSNQPTLEIIEGEFNAPKMSRGTGSPEGVVTADPSSIYYNRNGGADVGVYHKLTGTSNTGWSSTKEVNQSINYDSIVTEKLVFKDSVINHMDGDSIPNYDWVRNNAGSSNTFSEGLTESSGDVKFGGGVTTNRLITGNSGNDSILLIKPSNDYIGSPASVYKPAIVMPNTGLLVCDDTTFVTDNDKFSGFAFVPDLDISGPTILGSKLWLGAYKDDGGTTDIERTYAIYEPNDYSLEVENVTDNQNSTHTMNAINIELQTFTSTSYANINVFPTYIANRVNAVIVSRYYQDSTIFNNKVGHYDVAVTIEDDEQFITKEYSGSVTGSIGIGNIADGDATPDVSDESVFTYDRTPTQSVTITDLDNPVVGAIYRIIGSSDTYTVTINDSGNFNLSGNWTGGIDDVITIFVQSDNDYIEISRSDN